MEMMELQERLVGRQADIARYGLGLVLVFVGVHKLFSPGIWASYVAPQLYGLGLDWTALMQYSSIIEAGIGFGLLSGRYRRTFSALAAVSVLVVVLNLVLARSFFDLIIRDLGLLVLAIVVLADAIEERQ